MLRKTYSNREMNHRFDIVETIFYIARIRAGSLFLGGENVRIFGAGCSLWVRTLDYHRHGPGHDAVHVIRGGEMDDPGAFAVGFPRMTTMGFLMLHIAFGVSVGALYEAIV